MLSIDSYLTFYKFSNKNYSGKNKRLYNIYEIEFCLCEKKRIAFTFKILFVRDFMKILRLFNPLIKKCWPYSCGHLRKYNFESYFSKIKIRLETH